MCTGKGEYQLITNPIKMKQLTQELMKTKNPKHYQKIRQELQTMLDADGDITKTTKDKESLCRL